MRGCRQINKDQQRRRRRRPSVLGSSLPPLSRLPHQRRACRRGQASATNACVSVARTSRRATLTAPGVEAPSCFAEVLCKDLPSDCCFPCAATRRLGLLHVSVKWITAEIWWSERGKLQNVVRRTIRKSSGIVVCLVELSSSNRTWRGKTRMFFSRM